MKFNRKYLSWVAAIVLVATIFGGWLYLHSPAEGRLCNDGQSIQNDADGKLFTCQSGAIWKLH
ncbi:hypothetical protein [Methylotenera sp.]|uniref:hypothetical protein n=1 Tax=Methylotenera sp. TaxID=2051956 RepID=UPI002ED78525